MLPFADPFAMSLKRAERVQAFEPDGTETCAPDARWAFMARANVTDKEPDEEDTEEVAQEEKPTLPWRALEAIQTAKGEVDVILDLVALVRQQEVVATTNVQKPRMTIGDLAAEHALRAQSKVQQLRGASQQLRRGVAHLRERLDRNRRFYADLAHLQRDWNVQGTGAVTKGFAVDLALQPPDSAQPSTSLVDVLQGSDGGVCVMADQRDTEAGMPAGMVSGVSAVHKVLIRRQDRLVWQSIREAVLEEASQLDVPLSEAQQLLQQIEDGGGSGGKHAALRAAVLGMFADNQASIHRKPLLAAVGIATSPPLNILRHIRAQHRHDAMRSTVEADLQQLTSQHAELSTQRLPSSGPQTAAFQLSAGNRQLLVIVAHERLHVEQYGSAGKLQQGRHWALDAHTSANRQQLRQMVQELCGTAAL